jgi:pilus assembly protein CpaB
VFVSRLPDWMIMKKARLAVLGSAVLAGGAAAWLLPSPPPPPPPPTQVVQAGPNIETEDVLIAGKDLPMGTLVGSEGDITWQPWPKAAVSVIMVKKPENAGAVTALLDEIKGSVTRGSFLQGEPIRRDKLVKGPNSGFLSAILPSGMRALAINTDQGGSSTAGGFILPNDRVDIIRIYRDDEASKSRGAEVISSETIVANVRVLAIAENVQEKNGERFVKGQNATLELTPAQSELVVASQRISGGTLSLALRSMLDANKNDPVNREKDNSLTVVRFGVSTQAGTR